MLEGTHSRKYGIIRPLVSFGFPKRPLVQVDLSSRQFLYAWVVGGAEAVGPDNWKLPRYRYLLFSYRSFAFVRQPYPFRSRLP